MTMTGETNEATDKQMKTNILQLSLQESEAAIARLQRFLQFETVSATGPGTGAYKECAAWLVEELKSLQVFWNNDKSDDSNIQYYLPEAPEHSPVVVAKWTGLDETLPVLLLNSHYDVVPADIEKWTVPPFEGVRKDGKVYGRGAQDMKCVCLQYIEGIRQLLKLHPTYQPKRTIYLTFVPDEEIGGAGMAAFLDSALYKGLPGIALALDEGLASTSNTLDVFYGERLPWWIDVTATGPTGHGSRFIDNTAVEQLVALTQKALQFRKGQRDLLEMSHEENCTHAVVAAKNNKKNTKKLGDVTSLNITTLQAGVRVGDTFAYNCVPQTAQCSLDIRISPHMEPIEMKNLLDQWCQECSTVPGALTWSYLKEQNSAMEHSTTTTDRQVNPWYAVFCDTLGAMDIEMVPQVFPAATDSRFLRALGIRALGFSPMRNTEILLHEHDEYILEHNYLEGIGIYVELIQALGSQGDEMEELLSNKKVPAEEAATK